MARVTSPDLLDPAISAALQRDAHGLVAAIVQDHDSRDVLMLGWMDDEALRRTLTSGRVTFWSRSRGEYWRKGDTSGHVQHVRSVHLDCDGDAVLVEVFDAFYSLDDRRQSLPMSRDIWVRQISLSLSLSYLSFSLSHWLINQLADSSRTREMQVLQS